MADRPLMRWHRSNRGRHLPLRLLTAGVAALLVACGSPTQLEEVEIDLSELSLRVRDAGLGGSGPMLLEIGGSWSDPDFDLRPHQRVRLSVRTGGGDVENLLVGPSLCWNAAGAPYACNWILVTMRPGEDVRMLRDPVEHFGGLVTVLGTCSSFDGECQMIPQMGRIFVPDARTRDRVMGFLGLIAEVAGAGGEAIGELMMGPRLRNGLEGLMILREGPPVSQDGIVQAAHGDHVFVEPAGGGAEANLTVVAGGR